MPSEPRGRSLSSSPEPEPVSPSVLPRKEDAPVPEVSMVEASEVTGVSFTPELWMQRRAWALEVLRREQVSSVLDLGCGPGALLETLIIPPPTIREAPILPSPEDRAALRLDEPGSGWNEAQEREVFLQRLGGLDNSSDVLPAALATLSPGSSPSAPPAPSHPALSASSTEPQPSAHLDPSASLASLPRWSPMTAELWLGNIERYNSRLEGYEAIVALEVIEHLDQRVLDRFGVVCLGTYRPRVLLISTPNFDFNSKFPRGREHESDFATKGFMDPTGRTERVFRHSDHKLEWTFSEFTSWATSSAADWGYTVSVSGVGVSSSPSHYPDGTPIYATSTACFRLQAAPMRSPRSVRSTQLPFMPGSREASHPHRLAGRFEYPVNVNLGSGAASGPAGAAGGSIGAATPSKVGGPAGAAGSNGHRWLVHGHGAGPAHTARDPAVIRRAVRRTMGSWGASQVSLTELWGAGGEVALVSGGSKRALVGALGGYGDVPPTSMKSGRADAGLGEEGQDGVASEAAAEAGKDEGEEGEYELRWAAGRGLLVFLRGGEGRIGGGVRAQGGAGEEMQWESERRAGPDGGSGAGSGDAGGW